jgi:hypothetical protein
MAEAGVPVYDGTSVIGAEAAPWLYAPGASDDGTHPNDAATEAITPAVRRLLEHMLAP